ncbi:hypothetical protein AKJ51_03085 [candidate division MSBL1 archaeon SCGC-AAA382A20]|uniref:Methyltransferase small domain-containing protein n=1 Tax=candidate division MSBL1 archaeon SCGC-AAA382A20 TaxID=1698280 RepID=A0A133VJT6_9EURY|nr:hypothetical protein AKJ51_03085 [candidate division MSBL1 archaeon SCGC-AAA382A20]
MPIVIYKGQEFQVHPKVYKPAEDSFLLLNNLDIKKGEKALELGTGCGIISIVGAKSEAEFIATDISSKALSCAKENAKNHQVEEKIEFRKGNLFQPIGNERFDLIIFNPPYLPVSGDETLDNNLDAAWNGGRNGRKFIDKFLNQIQNYLKSKWRFFFVQSSLSGIQETQEILKKKNFQFSTKTKKISFEKLYLFMVEKKTQ